MINKYSDVVEQKGIIGWREKREEKNNLKGQEPFRHEQ